MYHSSRSAVICARAMPILCSSSFVELQAPLTIHVGDSPSMVYAASTTGPEELCMVLAMCAPAQACQCAFGLLDKCGAKCQ